VRWLDRVIGTKQPQLPKDMRIYAVGDIHGHADLLAEKLARIDEDLRKRPISHSVLVTVGDYIDRGPDSKGVIDLLISRPVAQRAVFLKGNHETFALEFPKNPSLLLHWQKYGALDTLRSYGFAPAPDLNARALQDLADRWDSELPADHKAFMSQLALSYTCGDYFFVHAGVKPGVPLKRQSERDLIWIRDEFLDSEKWFGKKIVHGHTPVPEPDFRPNRINIDTGVYMTGRLTCLVLQEKAADIL
jgi:serine/threonine protein phosphatase 1